MGLGVKIKHYANETLEEDTVASAVAKEQAKETAKEVTREVDNIDVVQESGDIEVALNDALKTALQSEKFGLDVNDRTNVLLVGLAGVGKTARIRAWAKRHNINLFEVRAAGMDDTDLGGAVAPSKDYTTVTRLASTEFDFLDQPRSVLFLDELNRAPKGVRTNLLELINSHVVPDPRAKNGQRLLKNFLFTVAAINPYSADYDTDKLDDAEIGRFAEVETAGDPLIMLNHLEKTFQDIIDKGDENDPDVQEMRGRLALAKAILGNKEFSFDTASQIDKDRNTAGFNGRQLQPRTFSKVLLASNGTKDDLLKKWNQHCNNLRKPAIERMLSNYKDIEDKANKAIQADTESSVFKKRESAASRIAQKLADLA